MGFLDNLQSTLGSVLGQTSGGNTANNQTVSSGNSSGGGLADILGPGLLGGLIGAILPGKGGMLKAGGATAIATMIWNKYKDKIVPPAASAPAGQADTSFNVPPTSLTYSDGTVLNTSASRMIRALVFAAKSDGHIDVSERKAISDRLRQINAGPEAAQLVEQSINEPLDPKLVAAGVTDPQEAIALFLASCSVINIDHFMESAYLDGLAQALGIPDQMKKDIAAEAQKQ